MSYRCAFSLRKGIMKFVEEDLEFSLTVLDVFPIARESEIKYDEGVYKRLMELIDKFIQTSTNEHLKSHAFSLKSIVNTALKLKSGIKCAG